MRDGKELFWVIEVLFLTTRFANGSITMKYAPVTVFFFSIINEKYSLRIPKDSFLNYPGMYLKSLKGCIVNEMECEMCNIASV